MFRKFTPGFLVLTAPLLAFSLAAWAPPARAEVTIPPAGGRSVHDLAGVMDPQQVAILERLHQELFEKTGVALTILTVPDLEGEAIEDLAVRAGEVWGVGRKGEDRGIVVALSVNDRKLFTATGYGVEGFLPDGLVGSIQDRYVVPLLKKNDFSNGLVQASAALASLAAQEYGVQLSGAPEAVPVGESGGRRGGIGSLIYAIIMGLVFLFLLIRHPRLLFFLLLTGALGGRRGYYGGGFRGGGFGGGGGGFGGFGGGGFGGGGAGRSF